MNATAHETKLSLGPLLFNWTDEKKRDFYFRIAEEAPIDVVYIGEVVCSKRGYDYIADVVDRLQDCGKQVILSSLALVVSERDHLFQQGVGDMVNGTTDDDQPSLMIEVNDISMLEQLSPDDLAQAHAIGPYINIYNEGALRYFERKGATRISLNHELSKQSLAALASVARAELEIQIFGRLPLAISARCYHARAHGLSKTGCQYVCDQDHDGLTVNTLNDEPFLAINGLQTLSYTYCNLLNELETLKDMGIYNFRLSPHDVDMVAVARLYRDFLDQDISGEKAAAALEQLVGNVTFSNGFFHGQAGFQQLTA